MALRQVLTSLHKNGIGVLQNFLSPQVCDEAIKEIDSLILGFTPTQDEISVFHTRNGESRSNEYFLGSSDKVRFFFEEEAIKNGKVVVPKLQSINKIGHALHEQTKIFRDITYREEVKEICRGHRIPNPVVVQSMAILKPPKIGGQVSIHQDSTFLYDQPLTLLGFWIPLQDATLENGCLWGIPGSHEGPLYKRNKMNWDKRESYDENYHQIDYKTSDFVPFEMKKGSLAIFTGKFLHKSEKNSSNISRYAYTWHLKDRETKWSPENWLQREKFPEVPFMK